jgi:DNA polymerase III subunit gamma/tau
MSTNNLYKKYRPLKLDEVCGQEKVVKDLKKRSLDNSFSHTMLFSGYSGLGKTTLQRIVAKNILCKNKDQNGNSCNTCYICKTIDEEKPSNFYFEINASNLNIDETRALVEASSTRSLSSVNAKVFVIDELQEMKKTPAALKNLLKPLETNSSYLYFILGTMQLSDIPDAIKNRCVPYKLHQLSYEDITQYLCDICNGEGIQIDTEEKANTLITIAQNSNGSMRTAVSYLERCIYSEIWDSKELLNELNIISDVQLVEIINKLLSNNMSVFTTKIDKDLLERVRQTLNAIYKHLHGVELEFWQKNQLKGINKTSVQNVFTLIEGLNKLTYFPYITQELIDFTLINAMKQEVVKEKLVEESNEELQVKQRVRVKTN